MDAEQNPLFGGTELAKATSDPAARAEALRREIEHHSYQYYALDAPTISDAAFDSLMRELREIEAGAPELVICLLAHPAGRRVCGRAVRAGGARASHVLARQCHGFGRA
ncbi:MAG: DNA ligase LigA-related protein [Coriobacteriaceae bacterium]